MALAPCVGLQCTLKFSLLLGIGALAVRCGARCFSTPDGPSFEGKHQGDQVPAWEDALRFATRWSFVGPPIVSLASKLADSGSGSLLSTTLAAELFLVPVAILAHTAQRWAHGFPEVGSVGLLLVYVPYAAAYASGIIPKDGEVVAHLSDLSTQSPYFIAFFWGTAAASMAMSLGVEHRRAYGRTPSSMPREFDYLAHFGCALLPFPTLLPLDDHYFGDYFLHRTVSPLAVGCCVLYAFRTLLDDSEDHLGTPAKAAVYFLLLSPPLYFGSLALTYRFHPMVNAAAAVELAAVTCLLAFMHGLQHTVDWAAVDAGPSGSPRPEPVAALPGDT